MRALRLSTYSPPLLPFHMTAFIESKQSQLMLISPPCDPVEQWAAKPFVTAPGACTLHVINRSIIFWVSWFYQILPY